MKKTKENISNNKKVLVGISGGVDSSVAALLLKQNGYQVEGVFAKVWQPDFVECTWRDEMKDAMRVCAKLEIPFHFLNLENEYKKHVADYMISEYQSGRTPNPDVMCNTHIKFGFIYDFAIKNDFDYVATGHYAQNIQNKLHRGEDTNKDQSYFIWNVPTNKFEKILFPIGNINKDEVRKIAEKNNLFTSEKKDSQGLCFIGPVDIKIFLKKLIDTKPGDVQNLNGEKIGTHQGVLLYTIGERHGFNIFPEYKNPSNKALFVVKKKINENVIIVSDEALLIKEVKIANTLFHDVIEDENIEVQFRYRQKPIMGKLVNKNNIFSIVFDKEFPTFVAEGQSAVIYKGKKCLGGGIVEEIITF